MTESEEVQKRRDALQAFIEREGLVLSAWAREADVSEGAVRNFIAGRSRSLSTTTLQALARVINVHPWELIGDMAAGGGRYSQGGGSSERPAGLGEDGPVIPDHIKKGGRSGLRRQRQPDEAGKVRATAGSAVAGGLAAAAGAASASGREFPVYFAELDGNGPNLLPASEPDEWIARPEPLANVRQGYGLYMVGDSMEPAFEQGDILLVNPRRPVQRNTDILLEREGEDGRKEGLVRRLLGWSNTHWTVLQYKPRLEEHLSREEWPQACLVVGKFSRL